jgi:methylated-DNA-protein-cysteine methyltransferase-like protein
MTVSFEEAVERVLLALAPGEVVTYGEVAAEAGFPGAARAVGNLLSRSGGEELPWWRVVRADGRLSAGDPADQAQRLGAEGVKVAGGRVRTSLAPGPRGAAR